MPRVANFALFVMIGANCETSMAAAPPSSTDFELVHQARAALAEVRAFERLNADVVRRCGEPVTGSWSDWREEFRADLERARALDKALQRRAPDPPAEQHADERLRPFTEVDGQALYSRCVRWSSLLIQHESPLRAAIAQPLGYLRENEQRLRSVLGNDAAWQEWRAAGALP